MPLHISTRADDADKHELDVNKLLFHKGKLYSAGDDGKVKAWAEDLKFLAEVQAHPSAVFCLTASDDTLYSCSNDGTVKAWALDTLQDKGVVHQEADTEFWSVKYSDGVLYSGDDQGNVKFFKNHKLFGAINVAEPVKHMVIKGNLLFTVKDNDVVVTDLHLHLGGEPTQFSVKTTIMGRGPIALIDDKLIFISREGKDLILNVIGELQHVKEVSKVAAAHSMIINALTTASWDGQSILFSGGWDKIVKQWSVSNEALKEDASLNVDIVVNALATGEKGQIYAGGSDGHIVRVDL